MRSRIGLKAEHEVFGWPAAEMAERDKEYELQMTLPGFDAKEPQVTVSPSEIIVHAEAKSEKKTEEPNVIWTEFSSNDVYRRFEMLQPIDVEKTRATLDKGILRITAAKTAAAKQKLIAVAAA
jgi:HSP20 family protein